MYVLNIYHNVQHLHTQTQYMNKETLIGTQEGVHGPL